MSGRRRERVGDLLRDEVSEIILRELSDPRLGFISVTRVDMSPDMKHARFFVSVFGSDDEQASTLVALNNATGYIRKLLAPRLRMRAIPELTFRLDHSMEHAENVARILRELEPELRAADVKPASSDDGTPA
jgi:ribosome-binding factor A